MSRAAIALYRVVDAVRAAFPLSRVELPDEFFPAHLSGALFDAVFRSAEECNDSAAAAVERYCRRFRIARTRTSPWHEPAPEVQETLADMIGRFEELGMPRMHWVAFGASQHQSAAGLEGVALVLRAARQLRRCGVEVIQDIQALPFEQVGRALAGHAGFDETATRRFLMYTGNDDFVCGDRCVRRFVADALARKEVSAATAESLVRRCAYELILSPRYLDNRIWRRHSAWSMVA